VARERAIIRVQGRLPGGKDLVANTTVTVTALPACDICGAVASYDAKTSLGGWASLCKADFARYGVGLGLGKGQKLVVAA
jgi:hypothetical protein